MSNGGADRPRPSRNEQREAAREKARVLREEQKKRERRNRWLIQGGIIVAVLAVAGLVAGLLLNNVRPAGPGPANMASDGIVLTGAEGAITPVETPALAADATPTPTVQDDSGTVANIVTYIDYLCPFCGQFEQTNSESIRAMIEEGAATLEVHPIAILTNKSAGTQYSLRAANAAACVADYSPDVVPRLPRPACSRTSPKRAPRGSRTTRSPSSRSRPASRRSRRSRSASTTSSSTRGCRTPPNRALTEPVPNSDLASITGTPTVLVNGKQYVGSLSDPAEFQSFVLQATGETFSESNATPTPTPGAVVATVTGRRHARRAVGAREPR